MLVLRVGHRVYVAYESQRQLFASSSESIKKMNRKFDNNPMAAMITIVYASIVYVIVCDIVLVVVKEEQ